MLIDLEPEKVTSTNLHMPAALRRAGSGLLRCFGRVLGAGESFRGGTEACWLSLSGDLASAPSMKNAARVQSESGRLNCTVPDEPDVCDDHAVGAVGSQ